MTKPTVFISYRREGGADLARYLHDKLSDMGMNVFIDVDDLSIGNFKRDIEQQIVRCEFFVVVLTPTTLESQWVRTEIQTALAHNKFIIPFVTREFSFYKHIPDEVKQLGDYNAIEYDFRNPDIAFEKLRVGIFNRRDTLGRKPQSDLSPKRPTSTTTNQQRNLQAAMPACSQSGMETEVRIKIVLPDSAGLRAELPEILPSGDVIQKSDVRDNTFQVKLEQDTETGQLQPGTVCLEVDSSDYLVEAPRAEAPCELAQVALEIDPEFDSRTVVFRLLWNTNNKRIGLARVFVRLTQNGKIIAETSVSTQIVKSLDEHPTCNMWQLQLAHLTMGSSGLTLGGVSTGFGGIGAAVDQKPGKPGASVPPPPSPASPIVSPMPQGMPSRQQQTPATKTGKLDDAPSTEGYLSSDPEPADNRAEAGEAERNLSFGPPSAEMEEQPYELLEESAKEAETSNFDLEVMDDEIDEDETVKSGTYHSNAPVVTSPSGHSDTYGELDDGIFGGDQVTQDWQNAGYEKDAKKEIHREIQQEDRLESTVQNRSDSKFYPAPMPASRVLRKSGGSTRVIQLVSGFVVVLCAGIIAVSALGNRGGNPISNEGTEVLDANAVMMTQTAESLAIVTSIPESTNSDISTRDVDQISTQVALTGIVLSQTAMPTNTPLPTPTPPRNTVTITVHWRQDGFVIENTSDQVLDISGFTLSDGENNYEVGSFIPESILLEFRPGRCLAVYAESRSTTPPFINVICENVVGEEGTTETNFLWLADRAFQVIIRGVTSTCVNQDENQCEIQVPIDD